MNEVEAVSEGLKNIGELGAIVVAALVLLVIAVLLVVWLLLSSRRDMKEREAQMVREAADREAAKGREEAERVNNGALLQALVGHVSANQGINERLIKVLEGANSAQQGTADALGNTEKALKDLTGIQTLAIGEAADQIRKTREDIGGVGGKVDGVDQKIALVVPAVEGGIDRVRVFIEDSTNKLSTQQAIQTAKLITSMSEILEGMQSALSDNFQQTAAGNAELYKTVKDGLLDLQETLSKITRIEVVKAVDAPKRDTVAAVELYDDNGVKVVAKTNTANGIHKVEPPTPESKPDEAKPSE